MLIEMLDEDVKKALADRLESWEIVDFLEVDVYDVIELLEDQILDKLNDVLEFAGIEGLQENNDTDAEDS